jgi:hypothetical protein
MLVHLQSTGVTYRMGAGLTNGDWTIDSSGSVTAGNGLTGTTAFAVLANGTSLEVSASGVRRTALTGAVSAAAGSNVTAFTSGAFGALPIVTSTSVTIASGTVASTGDLRTDNSFVFTGRNSFGGVDVNLMSFDGTIPRIILGSGNTGGMTSYIYLNTSDVTVAVGTNSILQVTSTAITPLINTLAWSASVVTAPIVSQANNTAGSGTGQLFTLRAQSCTGATSNGGACDIGPGAGTTAGGLGRCMSGGTSVGGGAQRIAWNDTGIGFYTTAPVAQPTDIVALTDSTTGTADNTVADVGAAFNQATLNNNFADLIAKINGLRTRLRTLGLMA